MTEPSPRTASVVVSVVIPNLNGEKWLPGCLTALARQRFDRFEVIVVDNGSSDGSLRIVREVYPAAQVLALGENKGFAAAANAGIAAARGTFVALLNTDTLASPHWLVELVDALQGQPDTVAAAASKMLQMDNPALMDDAGDTLSWMGAATKIGHDEAASVHDVPGDVFSVCAGAALYRRSFLTLLGGFDHRFFAYLEDVDLCFRGRLLGYRYIYVPGAEIVHKGQGSGLPRAAYVRLVTRNRVLLLGKNVPWRLLVRHGVRLAYGQLYFLVAYAHPFHSLIGYFGALAAVPHMLAQRRLIARQRRVTTQQIDRMLTRDRIGPPLRELLWRRIERWWR